MYVPSNLISIHNVVIRAFRVLLRGRIYGSQAWYVITCVNLSCIPCELVEVVCLCILYSHIYSGSLILFVDVGRLTEHVKSLCLLVYFSLSSYSWSFEVCFASFRVYTCWFSVLTSGIRARFNDGVMFSGSIIDDWTRLERGVHLDGCSFSRNLFDSHEDFVGEIVSERFSCWDINFAKEIMKRRNKLLYIKSRR